MQRREEEYLVQFWEQLQSAVFKTGNDTTDDGSDDDSDEDDSDS